MAQDGETLFDVTVSVGADGSLDLDEEYLAILRGLDRTGEWWVSM